MGWFSRRQCHRSSTHAFAFAHIVFAFFGIAIESTAQRKGSGYHPFQLGRQTGSSIVIRIRIWTVFVDRSALWIWGCGAADWFNQLSTVLKRLVPHKWLFFKKISIPVCLFLRHNLCWNVVGTRHIARLLISSQLICFEFKNNCEAYKGICNF